MKKFIYYSLSVIISFLLYTPVVLAQGLNNALGNLGSAGKAAGTAETSVEVVVGQTIFTALSFVGIIFLVLMVYAGYLWMMARGDQDMVNSAQRIIRAAVIGLVVVMSAYAITAVVTTRLGSVG